MASGSHDPPGIPPDCVQHPFHSGESVQVSEHRSRVSYDRKPHRTGEGSLRLVPWLVIAVSVCAIGVGVVMLWRAAGWRSLDDDELQHLHFAWSLHRGLIPYRDFWDNHSPLLHEILRQWLFFEQSPSAALLEARRLVIVLLFPSLVGTYLLGTLCFGRAAGLAAAGWLACSPLLLLKGTEVRPDGWLLSCTALATWLLVLSAQSLCRVVGFDASGKMGGTAGAPDNLVSISPLRIRPYLYMLMAGAVMGAGFTASTKGLIVFTATMMGWVAAMGLCVSHAAVRIMRCAAFGIAGFLVPVFIWWFQEALRGDAGAAIRMTLIENFIYPQRFNPWPMIQATGPYPMIVAALVGETTVLMRWWKCRKNDRHAPTAARHPAHEENHHEQERHAGGMTLAAAGGLFLLLGAAGMACAVAVMPAPYLQSALPCLPFIAALAGGGTVGLLEWLRVMSSPVLQTATAGGVVLLFAVFAVGQPILSGMSQAERDRPLLAGAMYTLDHLHALTGADDVVFDGRCAAVFRLHAFFYPALVQGVLIRYQRGEIRPRVHEQLAAAPPTLVLRDSRTSALPDEDWAWINAHYVSLPPPRDWLMVPGWTFADETRDAREAVTTVQVLRPGRYMVLRDHALTRVRINGADVGDEVTLSAGYAVVHILEPVGRVTLARRSQG